MLENMIVGGGAIGLAAAIRLAQTGRPTALVETESGPGRHASSRSSEVLHSGIYYEPGSLVARLTPPGRRQVERFADQHGVRRRTTGKLIVAQGMTETHDLARLAEQGAANGIKDLQWLDSAAARALEPRLRCDAAILSASTGIIDSEGLIEAMRYRAEAAGAMMAFQTSCDSVRRDGNTFIVTTAGARVEEVRTRHLIVAAGMATADVAGRIDGLDPGFIPQVIPVKGTYFTYRPPSPFSHLVYPMPEASGLGIHATLDLAGRTRFGPDAEPRVSTLDVSNARREIFVERIRNYFPEIEAEHLEPGYAGIRARIDHPSGRRQDFRLLGPDRHGVEGLFMFFGIESPGLTCCLALAEHLLEAM